jgi:hypothetical protein
MQDDAVRPHSDGKDAALRLMLGNTEMKGFTGSGARQLLRAFVLQGNHLTVRQETRSEKLEENPDDPFWYRAIIPVPEFPNGLFLEVKLVDEDEEEPFVEIVSANPQS